MKIVMSADSVRSPLTGIGQYTWQLAHALRAASDDLDISYLRRGRIVCDLPALETLTRAAPPPGRGLRLAGLKPDIPAFGRIYDAIALARAGAAVQRADPDVFHGTDFAIVRTDAARLVTIHDLTVRHWPQFHPGVRVRRIVARMRDAVATAHVVLAVSGYTRSEILAEFGIDPDRCRVTPLAAAPHFHPRTDAELVPALARLRLEPRGFTLFCGTIEPRKNLVSLIDAYERLPDTLRRRFPLVVSGGWGWNNAREHERMTAASDAGWLRYLGYTSVADQCALYAGARLFCLPSHSEGFGLPLLEAMASGTAAIRSTAPALAEVAADAAPAHEPNDVETLTGLLRRGLEDEHWNLERVRRGLERARAFSWQACARETLAAYGQALAIRNG